MQLRCYTAPDAFDELAEEWEALLQKAVTHTTFIRPFWQKAWWRAYHEGKDLCLLAVRDDDGELVGIAPLFVHEVVVDKEGLLPAVNIERPLEPEGGRVRRMLHPVGGTELSDYLDWVVAESVADQVYQRIWEYLRSERTDWELLDLHCLPDGSPTLTHLSSLAEEAGCAVEIAQEEVCPVLRLPDDWEDYLASLDKKQRHEIRRKVRKAHRQVDVQWRKTDDKEALQSDLELFYTLHEASAPEKAAFWDDQARQFFGDIAEALFDVGDLELSFMYYNRSPVATLFCFTDQKDLLIYNSGYEPERYRALTSGLVLLSHVIKDAIDRGLKMVDFMRGDERYKYDFGGVDTKIFRMGISSVAGD